MNIINKQNMEKGDFLLNEILKNNTIHGKSVLQIGARPNISNQSAAGWYKTFMICKKYGFEIFDILEIFRSNIENIKASFIRNKFHEDVLNINNISLSYDMIIWWHGPEHVSKLDFYNVLPAITNKCKYFVVGCPNGKYIIPNTSPNLRKNKHEKHVAHWCALEFSNMGFQVHSVYPPDQGLPLAAWRSNEK